MARIMKNAHTIRHPALHFIEKRVHASLRFRELRLRDSSVTGADFDVALMTENGLQVCSSLQILIPFVDTDSQGVPEMSPCR